jgi:hypothetical protein
MKGKERRKREGEKCKYHEIAFYIGIRVLNGNLSRKEKL